ncbi:MAG TPA: substrate-binding domain-containing protein [Tepidisphaeraceae bacterium]|nr:substrate-binding domain-containing protein [Tepidisphaeraceae bacterium]
MNRLLSLCVCVFAALMLAACDRGSSSSTTQPTGAAGGRRIAVIPKGTTHVFWKTVEAGARKAAEEAGVEMIWKGPLKEDDRAEQIKVVEQFVSEGVDGICLAPLDTDALARPVASAVARGIPVVIFDSSLRGEPGKDFASYVATNNTRGGEMAGEQLAKLLGGKGNVVMLRYSPGSGSTTEREEGFLKTAQAGGLTMLVDNRYGGATVASAKSEAMKLIDQLKQADGVFAPNESSTLGLLGALRDNQLAGKVKFVGFDATPPLLEALQNGEIHALVAQDPYRMGYLAVQTVVKKLNGETVEPVIDTGLRLITKESLQDSETRKFLNLD